MREKSEGPFGGVFPGAQKQQNPHEAGFGGASYLEKGDGFIFEENSPLTCFYFLALSRWIAIF
ncbi:hypothetical protein [Pseudomonas sp. MWU16-30323]|uniref:hypothetical protein n=1 Tax=Pseudomonas sp. MWU16-30323 TaxID=2878094 RepID=UPI001CFA0F4F|nr:hypothetical protein [Pseudomonas sp. MWU16-30323]